MGPKTTGAGAGALSGAAAGATIGSVVPVIGTAIGAAVGGIAGGALGASAAGNVPQYQQPSDDPQYLALKKQAEQDQLAASQDRLRIDSASLLARYGARLTTANAAGASPTMAPPLARSGA